MFLTGLTTVIWLRMKTEDCPVKSVDVVYLYSSVYSWLCEYTAAHTAQASRCQVWIMNDKKVDQVVLLELVKDQLMVSRCGNLPEETHASFSISACGHVCSADFDCKSMFSSIHNQKSSYLKRCTMQVWWGETQMCPQGFLRAWACKDGGILRKSSLFIFQVQKQKRLCDWRRLSGQLFLRFSRV